METIIGYIITLAVASIPAGIAYLASRRIQNADVAGKYQTIASKQAEDNIRLEKCQDELERRIDDLEKALRLKDGEIATLKGENAQLKTRVSDLEILAGNLETENAQLKQEIEALQRRKR